MDHNNDNNVDEKEDPFRLLPDELVLRILSFVTLTNLSNRVSFVSKRFRSLSLDPSLWKTLRIFCDDEKLHGRESKPLCVDEGKFSFNPRGKAGAMALIDRCTQLRTLTIVNRANASDLVCRALERNSAFGGLEEIQVQMFKCRMFDEERMLKTIWSHGKALRTLRLYNTMNLSGTLGRNPGCLQNLTSLLIGNSSVDGLFQDDLRDVADSCKNLRYLSFENDAARSDQAGSDQAMDYLFQGLRETLEGFRTPKCPQIYTDEAFKNINQCGRLTWLSMHFNEGLSGKTLDVILEIPLLRTLNLLIYCMCSCSRGSLSVQDFVRAFGKTREKLEHLNLSVKVLEDPSLVAIADGCPNLVSLSLNGRYLRITDQSISRVLEKCGKLRDLELTEVEKMTSKSFEKARAPLERLAFGDRYKRYGWVRELPLSAEEVRRMMPLSAKEKKKIKRMMPGLEICKEIRSYADENCWWESCELHRR